MTVTRTVSAQPAVSIIIPARNEQASLGSCLESLVSQTGASFEIILVDDASTDRTREIAASFSEACPNQVRVIEASPLPAGWTGKNNALITGVGEARGEWLLFTDADTVHLPGSLARALSEAKENHADLLSYSPQQIAVTFWEMAVLPVVFTELARQYPPSKVSDPSSPAAAANGQYILVKRQAYDAGGGHAAIVGEILEDVALARALKKAGRKIRFRYAPDAVRTRMYRNFGDLREGWTKNLARLFPKPGRLAAKTLLGWGIVWGVLLWFCLMFSGVRYPQLDGSDIAPALLPGLVTAIGVTIAAMRRLRIANFDWKMEFLGALFGMPMFAYLLLRSKRAYANRTIPWKGRIYCDRTLRDGVDTKPLTGPPQHQLLLKTDD
jgi:glycosyltransferase involved in cell wall biosynthesis